MSVGDLAHAPDHQDRALDLVVYELAVCGHLYLQRDAVCFDRNTQLERMAVPPLGILGDPRFAIVCSRRWNSAGVMSQLGDMIDFLQTVCLPSVHWRRHQKIDSTGSRTLVWDK